MIPETQPRRRLEQVTGIGLVNLATFTWATNMVLGRWLRDDIGPLTLAAARFLIASVLFAALLQRQPPEERHLGQSRWLLLGMALSGVAVFAPTLYLGLRFTTAVNATLMNGLGPLITGFLAALLIREPMSGRQVTGAIVGLIGVVSLISGGSFIFPLGGSATDWEAVRSSWGDLIVLTAVALWGLYSVLGRQVMRGRSALSATAFSAFLGLPLLLLAATWEVQAFPGCAPPGTHFGRCVHWGSPYSNRLSGLECGGSSPGGQRRDDVLQHAASVWCLAGVLIPGGVYRTSPFVRRRVDYRRWDICRIGALSGAATQLTLVRYSSSTGMAQFAQHGVRDHAHQVRLGVSRVYG